ncbi:hypothetical protein SAMN05892883_2788 [Jatrophihabitans sp. GAS493]|nr:hypothetical protein SAMN05892883_2788 [Jatrophihabitans sp. GAS493]
MRARDADEKLRDFIMDTKSYSRQLVAKLTEGGFSITPADLEAFVLRLLADVNTYMHREKDGTYEIMFHEPFLSDYPKHTKDQRRRTVALRPDVKPDSEHIEFLALGHPVVDDLIAHVTGPGYAGSSAAFEIDATGELAMATGWLVVQELGVPGIKDRREVVAYFVHDSGTVDTELGQRLMRRAASFPNDHALVAQDVPFDELDGALQAAEAVGFGRLDEIETQARLDAESQLARERIKLSTYFDYRDEAARDRLASSLRVLADLEATDTAETRRIMPVWRANVARDERLGEELRTERVRQVERLEHRAHGAGDSRLLAVARIEILEG